MKNIKKATIIFYSLTMLPLSGCVTPTGTFSESNIETPSSCNSSGSIESSDDSRTDENKEPSIIGLDDIPQFNDVKLVSDFKYSDFLTDEEDGYIELVAVIDDVVYLEKSVQVSENNGDIYYYQYNLTTGKSEKFDGYIADFNSSAAAYAFAGGCIYTTIETLTEQIHYKVDLAKKKVMILKSEPYHWSTISFINTINFDESSYCETYYDIDGDMLTYHVTLFTPTGEREIITKKANRNEETYSYQGYEGKIYEYSTKNHLSESYMTVYDANGNEISSEYLVAVSDAIQEDPDLAVSGRETFTDYYFYTIISSTNMNYQCMIQDTASDEVAVIENAMLYEFGTRSKLAKLLISTKKDDQYLQHLCFVDKNGSVQRLSAEPSVMFSVAASDDLIVFISQDTKQMYVASPYA